MYEWIGTEWLGLLSEAGVPEIWYPLISLGALMGIRFFTVIFGLGAMNAWGGIDLAGDLDQLGNFWPMVGSSVGCLLENIVDLVPFIRQAMVWISLIFRIPVSIWMGSAMMGGVEGVTIGGLAGVFSIFGTANIAGQLGAEIAAWATSILKTLASIVVDWIAPIESILETIGVCLALGGMYGAGMLT